MKTLLQRATLGLAIFMLVGFVGNSVFATVGCPSGFTVYLIDSYGAPLEGGTLYYKDGGTQMATDMGGGMFCVDTDLTAVDLKMEFCGADLWVYDVSTASPYTFQTVMVTFELRKRTGLLGYNFGEISFVGFGPNPFATTGEAGLGLATKELLPREYDFRMKFRGGVGIITQDVGAAPVVTWTMARMLVQVNHADGTRGVNGVDIKYKGSAMEQFGVTGTSENGRARRDLLVGIYKFTLKYAGGKMVVDDFGVVPGDNELIIQASEVTVELLDDAPSSYYYPVDGGVVTSVGVTSYAFGTTGDSGPGLVSMELLPETYSFGMNYLGDTDEQLDVDCTSDVIITFFTSDLKSSIVSANEMELAAYPNPFVGNTTLAFELDADQNVTAEVYDLTGKRIATIFEGPVTQGTHKMQWDGQGVNSGLYIFKLTTETSSYTQRLVKN